MPTTTMGTVFAILAVVLLLVSLATGAMSILKQKMSDPFFFYRKMIPPGMRMRPTGIPLVPLLIFAVGFLCLLIAASAESREARVKPGEQTKTLER